MGISAAIIVGAAALGLGGLTMNASGRSNRFSQGDMVVHVAGSVKSPGTYKISPGARWQDAIESAGGLRRDADRDTVNLAKRLRDGERIYVPSLGELPTSSMAPRPSSEGPRPSQPRVFTPSGPINLNTATQAELESVPGIGPTMATRILQLRVQAGGFQSVEQLADVKGIGEKTLNKLRPYFTVN